MDALRSLLFLFLFTALHADFSFAQKNDNAKSEAQDINPYVINGEIAPPTRFPYMCSLRARGTRAHGCGGFLVDQQWVVTAAHCVDPDFDDSLRLQPLIYCGTNRLDDDDGKNIFVPVDSRIHEKWNGDISNGYDIAMLKLDRKAKFALPDLSSTSEAVDDGQLLVALGWGRNKNGGLENFLQVAPNLPFIPNDQCNKAWYGLDKDRQMCAGLAFSDTCNGDSGGPLILPDAPYRNIDKGFPSFDLIVGVTSFGPSKCDSSKPGVYTNLGYFKDWIRDVIDGKPRQVPILVDNFIPPDYPPALSPDDVIEESSASSSIAEEGIFNSSNDLTYFDDDELLETMVEAIILNRPLVAQLVLEEGLDSNSRVNQTSGDSLLHWTARYNSPQCAKILIYFKAIVEIPNYSGETPLHHCGKFGSTSVAKILMKNGADVNTKDDTHWTPLHEASGYGQTKVVEMLIKKRAVIEAKSIEGWTPLHLASYQGYAEIVKILIDNGADVNINKNNGWRPLHEASRYGQTKVVEILVERGANIEARTDGSSRPLHFAAYGGYLRTVEVLLKKGAKRGAKNDNGNTPYDLICADDKARCSSEDRRRLKKLLK